MTSYRTTHPDEALTFASTDTTWTPAQQAALKALGETLRAQRISVVETPVTGKSAGTGRIYTMHDVNIYIHESTHGWNIDIA